MEAKIDQAMMNLVVDKLQNFGPKLVRKSFRKAARAVGSMWIEALKEKVPVDSGSLRDAIVMSVKTKMRMNKSLDMKTPDVSLEVGPRLDAPRNDDKKSVGPGIFGMWLEFGLKNKKYPAHPWVRPVYDATGEKAQQIFADELRADLESIAKE